jgi:hypothetical protein
VITDRRDVPGNDKEDSSPPLPGLAEVIRLWQAAKKVPRDPSRRAFGPQGEVTH